MQSLLWQHPGCGGCHFRWRLVRTCLSDGSIHNGGDCAVGALLATHCLLGTVDVGVCDVCVAELCDYVVGSLADTVRTKG